MWRRVCGSQPIAEWLGFQIDLAKGQFAVPERKVITLKAKLLELQNVRWVQARYLASVIGKISSLSLGLGPISHLMTRGLYGAFNKQLSWSQKLELTVEASEEMNFWLNNLEGMIFGLSLQQSGWFTLMLALRDMVAILLNMET